MVDIDFRGLVLTDGALDGTEEPPPVPAGLSDPGVLWPELEVVAASYADAVIVHRMDDHDELLVMLASRGQYYVRDADGAGTPRRLTALELAGHLEALGHGGIEAVPWSTPLVPGERRAEAFLALAHDPTFARLARSSQVICEYGAASEVADTTAMARVIRDERKGVTKAIMGAVTTRVGQRAAAAALGLALGLWSPWVREADVASAYGCRLHDLRDAVDVYERPQAFLALTRRFGLDSARGYLAGYLALPRRESWETEQASLTDFLEIVDGLGVDMKPAAFVSYAIEQRTAQGVNTFDSAHWLDLWADCLAMQDLVRGRVEDKYPTDLITLHDQLMREGVRLRHAIAPADAAHAEPIDPFERHRLELEPNGLEDGEFLIRPPRDRAEMLEEARSQHNCLAGYVRAFEHGDTDIYLLRRTCAPEVPHATVEVRGGEVRQAYLAYNRDLDPSTQAWFDRWCDRTGIAHNTTIVPRAVGLRYDDEPRLDPMAQARQEDLVTNRPGTWRRQAAMPMP